MLLLPLLIMIHDKWGDQSVGYKVSNSLPSQDRSKRDASAQKEKWLLLTLQHHLIDILDYQW